MARVNASMLQETKVFKSISIVNISLSCGVFFKKTDDPDASGYKAIWCEKERVMRGRKLTRRINFGDGNVFNDGSAAPYFSFCLEPILPPHPKKMQSLPLITMKAKKYQSWIIFCRFETSPALLPFLRFP